MHNKPVLSIVTPTLGKFSDYWLEQLLKVQGAVEFVMVYPPNNRIRPIEDSRVKLITSPFKGEMMQRFVALLNASGDYVLALDDDDLVHPDVVDLTVQYFNRFPESWILRLKKAVIDFREEARIYQNWAPTPDINSLNVDRKTPENPYPYQQGQFTGLLEVPISPLDKPLNLKLLLWPLTERTDNEGYHFENFNNVVWRNTLVQQALPDLAQGSKLLGPLTWIPFSGFDRLMGLFVQAKFFQKDLTIGHWLPGAEQIRYIDKPAVLKPPRFHVVTDVLLVKTFPQYGYLWNLFISKLYGVPRTAAKALRWRFRKPSIDDLVPIPEPMTSRLASPAPPLSEGQREG
ncbi:glycosyl transferase family A [Leptolyngbya sp. 'hensonii']|uniref:glycosyltransferase n=1 Tax=Leptolyngbya sp. 'hensonii' TaxID=1922337 RepID=UPI00094F8FAA|nr:glycosyltransferase [Leptolyngbya sp. 'hensonii']OLP17534.1 glycosyl transferase family A [Leptolyngbya sp. 'hensonii']